MVLTISDNAFATSLLPSVSEKKEWSVRQTAFAIIPKPRNIVPLLATTTANAVFQWKGLCALTEKKMTKIQVSLTFL